VSAKPSSQKVERGTKKHKSRVSGNKKIISYHLHVMFLYHLSACLFVHNINLSLYLYAEIMLEILIHERASWPLCYLRLHEAMCMSDVNDT
jgi:hypothetical protein